MTLHRRHGAGSLTYPSVILLHPPLPLVGVSIGMKRGRQQNDSLADGGYWCQSKSSVQVRGVPNRFSFTLRKKYVCCTMWCSVRPPAAARRWTSWNPGLYLAVGETAILLLHPPPPYKSRCFNRDGERRAVGLS